MSRYISILDEVYVESPIQQLTESAESNTGIWVVVGVSAVVVVTAVCLIIRTVKKKGQGK